jgi:REP element-mobilizing transposase RayT
MTRPLRIQYPDAFYHVTCRGNERSEIFRHPEDRNIFLELLARSLDIFEVQLGAYSLMPNHFHLLVCTPKGNLSEFMHHFNISYTGAFNRKYRRTGHLYQGRYKAFLIDADNYLLEVSRYIHLNPPRIKSKEPAEDRWKRLLKDEATSLAGYWNAKKRKEFVCYTMILDYLGGDTQKARNEYRAFVEEGFHKDTVSPLIHGKGTGIIGGDDFIGRIQQWLGVNKESPREQPALRELSKKIKPNDLIERYTKLAQIKREELTQKGRQSTERAMLMEFLYRFCNITQREIGRMLGGINYSAVSQSRKRLRQKIENELELRKRFNEMQSKIDQMSRINI